MGVEAVDDVSESIETAFPRPAVIVDPGRRALERRQLQPTAAIEHRGSA
jgi:hypothetical protein